MPKKYPSIKDADAVGVYPVITKHRSKFVVLTKTGESDGFTNIKDAEQHFSNFKKSNSKKIDPFNFD